MNRPIDYYEILQINRNADMETIHRVYRFLAVRYHPDNQKTGDMERFLLLREAFEVLSDPARRAKYDATNDVQEAQPLPIFELQDFIDGSEQEANRRVGVLAILYHRRRTNDSRPGLALLDLERRMALPREYLEFTLWYLRSKLYIHLEENSDVSITVLGVDYLETVAYDNKIAQELLWPRIAPPSGVCEIVNHAAA